MPRYFFDVRADEMVETDAIGADLACVEAVEDELTRGVAEILRGAAPHEELLRALERAGIDRERGEAEVTRMLATDILVEPRAGCYRMVEGS